MEVLQKTVVLTLYLLCNVAMVDSRGRHSNSAADGSWNHPCARGSRHTHTHPHSRTLRRPRRRDVRWLLRQIETEVIPSVADVQKIMIQRWFVDELERKQLLQLPPFPPFSEEVLRENDDLMDLNVQNKTQVIAWVKTSVRTFAWAAAYLGLARTEERLQINERTTLTSDLTTLESHAYEILCKLHKVADSIGCQPGSPLSSTDALPPHVYLPLDHFKRHRRDFIILRDYREYLNDFIFQLDSFEELWCES